MLDAAAIVLAGGRSSRMGAPKASLDWHGSTLLRRVTGILARTLDGPVVVVHAPGQQLPPLGAGVEVAEDRVPGRGPLEGLAAGLVAIGARAPVAYLSATDMPLLHPAFVARVVSNCGGAVDVALPDLDGFAQPLAAAYRAGLLGQLEALLAAGEIRPASLFERSRVLRLDAASLRADAALARLDPELASVRNLNEPAEYQRALAQPAPAVAVELDEAAPAGRTVRAWTLGDAAAAAGLDLAAGLDVTLNGRRIVALDPELPLVAGDRLAFPRAPRPRR